MPQGFVVIFRPAFGSNALSGLRHCAKCLPGSHLNAVPLLSSFKSIGLERWDRLIFPPLRYRWSPCDLALKLKMSDPALRARCVKRQGLLTAHFSSGPE